MYEKYEKICSRIMFVLMCISLGILMYYGRYNHPTGDDYYYGGTTLKVYTETGSLIKTIAEACRGAAYQYMHWQGTYSAMVLMYLPPNIFGEWAYKFVTTVILTLYTASLFYFSKPLLCGWLKASTNAWVCISSVFVMLTIQTVDFAGESFFWYNGSMYYTGFFSITLIFLGVVSRYFYDGKKYRIPIMLLLAVFLGGGNYVSLLPAIILLVTLSAICIIRRSSKAWAVSVTALWMIGGLIVSAAAPGNLMRESQIWEKSAFKAIVKSVLQGFKYIGAWSGVWWILAVMTIIPIIWHTYKNSEVQFKYPIIVAGYFFGVFCSMSCPTYYAENSTGPARAVAIVYYSFVLFSFAAVIYLLGAAYRRWNSKLNSMISDRKKNIQLTYAGAFAVLILIQLFSHAYTECNSARAVKVLLSGECVLYEEEYTQRMEILNNESIQEVIFEPYSVHPSLIYVGDFTQNRDDDNNVKAAEYFNKVSIAVDYSKD